MVADSAVLQVLRHRLLTPLSTPCTHKLTNSEGNAHFSRLMSQVCAGGRVVSWDWLCLMGHNALQTYCCCHKLLLASVTSSTRAFSSVKSQHWYVSFRFTSPPLCCTWPVTLGFVDVATAHQSPV